MLAFRVLCYYNKGVSPICKVGTILCRSYLKVTIECLKGFKALNFLKIE